MSLLLANPAAEALARVEREIDLSGLRFKLGNPEDGVAPPQGLLDLMESEYRRFLALRLAHPSAGIVPCKLVDAMWHSHILDTRAYADDCDRLFGGFMHHYPYFGMRGADDEQALADAYEETLRLYQEAFGEPPTDTWISAEPHRRCRTQCRPMKCK